MSVAQRPRQEAPDTASTAIELSIVMPCLNEVETLAACIRKSHQAIKTLGVAAEIIVADNGSTDGSQAAAHDLGARVVDVARKGYGSALMGGIAAARGRFVIMGDADDSYDFTAIGPLLDKLREGCDLVMGNRFAGGIQEGAMVWSHRAQLLFALFAREGNDLVMGNRFAGGIKQGAMVWSHRWVGNPVLTAISRLFFHTPVGDMHCGLRGFRKDAFERLRLRATGMEFASEMVIKASLQGLRISEVPVTLSPDGRSRPPHLRTWRDGWRHLRFMLLFSPRWLFLYPGIALFAAGLLAGASLESGPKQIGAVQFDIHTLLLAGFSCLIGYQLVVFAVFTKVFAMEQGFHPPNPSYRSMFRYVNLETGLAAGGLMLLVGIAGIVVAVISWQSAGFGSLDPRLTMREVIPAAVLLTLGVQTILASFFLSILGIDEP